MSRQSVEYRGLRASALMSASSRGHSLTQFSHRQYLSRETGSASCLRCLAMVSVDTSPPANGIDIGGEAVALNCPVEVRS